MARYIDITLTKKSVTCTAKLLDDLAPATCNAVWDALPLGNEVYHAKYARNEIYTLVESEAFRAGDEGDHRTRAPGLENPTITPIPGDIMYFSFAPWQLTPKSHGYSTVSGEEATEATMIDLALFYERNNLLLNPDFGFVPGTVFATVVEGLDDMAVAAQALWRYGTDGEALRFERRIDNL